MASINIGKIYEIKRVFPDIKIQEIRGEMLLKNIFEKQFPAWRKIKIFASIQNLNVLMHLNKKIHISTKLIFF